ncbi:MAG: lytic transglycosylase domain-containing protein [Actinomycetes bacterium]
MKRSLRWLLVLGALLLIAGVAVLGMRMAVQTVARPSESMPKEYKALILKSAKLCPQLPASILAAQIATESGWDPKAVSGAGAEGIAQFIPQTWKDYGYDANGDGTADVFDPADAIPSAAKFMCGLFDETSKVPGDPINNALAAYNAGPSKVRKYGGIPPFPETQKYVERIRARAATEAFASLDT